MPSTRSSNPKPKSSKSLATRPSPAKTPTADPVPTNQDENSSVPSIHSPKILQAFTDHNSPENPLGIFDKASSTGEKSGADEEGAESVSDFFDYPASSTMGIKSPYLGNRRRLQISPETGTSSPYFGDDGRSRRGSESTDGSIIYLEIYGRRKGSEVSRQGDWNHGAPIQDSPTMGRNFTASMKSPIMDFHGRQFSSSTGDEKSPRSLASPTFPRFPKSPSLTVDSIETTSTSDRAERVLHVPFLPKILRVLGSPAASEASPIRDEPEAVKEARNISVFEDESSDDEDEDDKETMEIHEARLGVIGRPVLVHHGSSTVVGLKEMLRSGPAPSVIHPPPSLGSRGNPAPSTTKVARLLGYGVGLRTDPISSVAHTAPSPRLRTLGPSIAKAAQILGHEVQDRDETAASHEYQVPIAGGVAAPIEAKETGNGKDSPNSGGEITVAQAEDEVSRNWRNPASNLSDGLRSNPVATTARVRRSATMPLGKRQNGAVSQGCAPPPLSAPLIIPPSSPSQLNEAINTDRDHYLRVVEEKLHSTMEELSRLEVELDSLKETTKVPRRSRSTRLIDCVLHKNRGPSVRK